MTKKKQQDSSATTHPHGRIEIVRTAAGYHVRVIGKNGEPLQTSEVLSSKRKARNNAIATAEIWLGIPTWTDVDERAKVIHEETAL